MRLAICDDEEITRNSCQRFIQKLYPEMDIQPFASAEALLASKRPFSLFLLDIEMNGMSGMALAKHIRSGALPAEVPEPVIVFITGYPEHMPNAFDVQALHYLMKPLSEEKLSEVLARAVSLVNRQREQTRDFLLLKSGALTQKTPCDDIMYIESSNKKLLYHTTGGVIASYGRIRDMEERLSHSFFRCHRCYLVNLAHIIHYDHTSITISSGEVIFLSRQKYSAFVQAFIRYAKTGGITRV